MLLTRVFQTIASTGNARGFSPPGVQYLKTKASLIPSYFDSRVHASMGPSEIERGIQHGILKRSSRPGAIEMASAAKQQIMECVSRRFVAQSEKRKRTVVRNVMYQASGIDLPVFYPMHVAREVQEVGREADLVRVRVETL